MYTWVMGLTNVKTSFLFGKKSFKLLYISKVHRNINNKHNKHSNINNKQAWLGAWWVNSL